MAKAGVPCTWQPQAGMQSALWPCYQEVPALTIEHTILQAGQHCTTAHAWATRLAPPLCWGQAPAST